MNALWSGIVTICVAIIGVAIIATLVSKNAQTPQVLQAAGQAFGGAITAAEGPVSGSMGLSSVNTLGNTLSDVY
jgi:hypothetical protein